MAQRRKQTVMGLTGLSSAQIQQLAMQARIAQDLRRQTIPITDLASGLTNAGNQILETLRQRQMMAEYNQMAQQAAAQEQAAYQAQAEAEAQRQQANYANLLQLGYAPEMAATVAQSGLDASVVNKILEQQAVNLTDQWLQQTAPEAGTTMTPAQIRLAALTGQQAALGQNILAGPMSRQRMIGAGNIPNNDVGQTYGNLVFGSENYVTPQEFAQARLQNALNAENIRGAALQNEWYPTKTAADIESTITGTERTKVGTSMDLLELDFLPDTLKAKLAEAQARANSEGLAFDMKEFIWKNRNSMSPRDLAKVQSLYDPSFGKGAYGEDGKGLYPDTKPKPPVMPQKPPMAQPKPMSSVPPTVQNIYDPANRGRLTEYFIGR